jgi:hypothetical protein
MFVLFLKKEEFFFLTTKKKVIPKLRYLTRSI